MTTSAVGVGRRKDKDRLVDAILLAFARDPVTRWAQPEPHKYLTHFRSFLKTGSVRAFEAGSAHHTVDFSGAAFWFPPGVEIDAEAVVAVAEKTLEPERLKTALSLLEQMASYHPAEPHWYLWMIGVDPAKQGHGHGKALLGYALDRIDDEGKAAYLENSNPANTRLYEKHGFKVVGTIQVNDAPPILPMVRRSRGAR